MSKEIFKTHTYKKKKNNLLFGRQFVEECQRVITIDHNSFITFGEMSNIHIINAR